MPLETAPRLHTAPSHLNGAKCLSPRWRRNTIGLGPAVPSSGCNGHSVSHGRLCMWRQTSASLAALFAALFLAHRALANDSPQQATSLGSASHARVVSLSFVHGTV